MRNRHHIAPNSATALRPVAPSRHCSNASISGVGGVCNLNPATPYQAPPTAQYQYQYQQPFNPMTVPPPPPGGM
jgi:hypothetical protein